METDYLKRCFGNSLTRALATVATVRPSDPIEYLAHWLYHYRKITVAKEESEKERIQPKEDDKKLKETILTEMLKQEETQLHKPPMTVASFTESSTLVQEKTEPHGNEASKQQQLLPNTSSVILRAPSEMPSLGLDSQTEHDIQNLQEINGQDFPPQVTHRLDHSSKYPS